MYSETEMSKFRNKTIIDYLVKRTKIEKKF